jgi:ribonuclease HI
MELQACISALKKVKRFDHIKDWSKIIVFTDSRYVVENCPKAIFEWRRNKWMRRGGAPVLNASLWKELANTIIRIYQKNNVRVDIRWVKGHANNKNNEIVDKMAKASSQGRGEARLNEIIVRRKISDRSVAPGCVQMFGQRLRIRIITRENLRMQKTYKYKYEVVDKDDPHNECVDIIFCQKCLRATHSYLVEVGDKQENPQILRVIGEI